MKTQRLFIRQRTPRQTPSIPWDSLGCFEEKKVSSRSKSKLFQKISQGVEGASKLENTLEDVQIMYMPIPSDLGMGKEGAQY